MAKAKLKVKAVHAAADTISDIALGSSLCQVGGTQLLSPDPSDITCKICLRLIS